jgi:hypothetical protein
MAILNSLDLVHFLNSLKEKMPHFSKRDSAYKIFKTWCSQKGIRRTVLINSMFNKYYPSRKFKNKVVAIEVRKYLLQNYSLERILDLIESDICITYTLKFDEELVSYILKICDENSEEYVLQDITSMEQGSLHVLRCSKQLHSEDEVELIHGRAPKRGYKKPRFCFRCKEPLTLLDWPNHCFCNVCIRIVNNSEYSVGMGVLMPGIKIPEFDYYLPPDSFRVSMYHKYKYCSK